MLKGGDQRGSNGKLSKCKRIPILADTLIKGKKPSIKSRIVRAPRKESYSHSMTLNQKRQYLLSSRAVKTNVPMVISESPQPSVPRN